VATVMDQSQRSSDEKPGDPISRYLDYMRTYAVALTRKADREARLNAETGAQQELDALFHIRDDDRDTQTRLERYAQRLRAAKRAGRYAGNTTLRRFQSDGTVEPWLPSA
jgi:hypothetical protein